MKRVRISLVCLALLGFAGTVSAQIKVENAWLRATVPNQQATGAFLKITTVDAMGLVAVSSIAAKISEIHEMKMEGGIMKMGALPEGLAIAANSTLELKSGGYHVMMMELTQTIKAGDMVPLQLHLADAKGKKQVVGVEARASFKDPYKP